MNTNLNKNPISPRAHVYFGGDAQSWDFVQTANGFEIHQVKNWRGAVVAARSYAETEAAAAQEFNEMADDADTENC